MTIGIRSADEADIEWLLGQLRKFSDFFGTELKLFGDEAQARDLLTKMILNHPTYIAESDQCGRMGFIAGVLTPHMFNPQITVLAETFWWVDELYRGTRAGLLLLNRFVAEGQLCADWITFALEAKSPVREETLTRRGFRLQERSYLMEVA